MLEQIVKRIRDLTAELEQSAAKHNSLVGAMQEVQALYQAAIADAPAVEAVVAAVAPEAAPALDAAVTATETVVADAEPVVEAIAAVV